MRMCFIDAAATGNICDPAAPGVSWAIPLASTSLLGMLVMLYGWLLCITECQVQSFPLQSSVMSAWSCRQDSHLEVEALLCGSAVQVLS